MDWCSLEKWETSYLDMTKIPFSCFISGWLYPQFAINFFLLHLLGPIVSPTFICISVSNSFWVLSACKDHPFITLLQLPSLESIVPNRLYQLLHSKMSSLLHKEFCWDKLHLTCKRLIDIPFSASLISSFSPVLSNWDDIQWVLMEKSVPKWENIKYLVLWGPIGLLHRRWRD